jgi:hypothetical protein
MIALACVPDAPLWLAALWQLAHLSSQSAKANDYRLIAVIVSASRRDWTAVHFRNGCPLALATQLIHAGADGLEIVGSSRMSHVCPPVRLIERSSPRPPSPSSAGSALGTSSSVGAAQLGLQFWRIFDVFEMYACQSSERRAAGAEP